MVGHCSRTEPLAGLHTGVGRWHFHLVNDTEVLFDLEGIEVDDVSDAVGQIVSSLLLDLEGRAAARSDWEGWSLEVTDTRGTPRLTVDLEAMARAISAAGMHGSHGRAAGLS